MPSESIPIASRAGIATHVESTIATANHIPLSLFAKTPVAGTVKTRLEPQLGAQRCAALARMLLLISAVHIRRGWPGPVRLCCWPEPGDPFLTRLARRLDLEPVRQVPGDLGTKMAAEMARGIARAGAAAVMGADTPQCMPTVLADAAARMAEGADLIGEAVDGGFWFLGLSRLPSDLFDDVSWSTTSVTATVVERARVRGINLQRSLPRLRDVDTWEDLLEVSTVCPPLARVTGVGHADGGALP